MVAANRRGSLDARTVAYLRDRGTECVVEAGEPVVRRGQPGRAFYLVLDGEVEVRLTGEDGRHLHLTRLGPGASFGEMAILRREPVSADVVALSRVSLLAYPAEHLHTALAECETLRTSMLARMADDLDRTSSEAWELFQRAEALRLLVRGRPTPEPLIAESARARRVEQEIAELATEPGPLLISGEPGTAKLLAAQLLHQAGCGASAPLIIIDCHRLRGSDAGLLLGVSTEATTASAVERLDRARSTGLARTGVLHLTQGGCLVLRCADTLDAMIQERVAEAITTDPRTRIILTVNHGGGADSAAQQLSPTLAARITSAGSFLVMPRLIDRPRDILPLARYFLSQSEDGEERSFSRDAEHALVSLRCRHRNVVELREAVEVAALCADGPEIRAEHIFSGPRSDEEEPGFDLTRLPLLQRLVHGPMLRLLRGATLLGFLVAIGLCLFAGDSTAGGTANGLIWSCWEPLVFALFLLVGRVWCTICPLSTAGLLAQRLGCLGRPPSAWLKRHGVWFAIAGFLLIVWSERFFHMTSRPLASGLMLLLLIAASVVCCLVYRREVWCRHLCPLGALAGALAPPATLGLVANPRVCASSCTNHACYKGSAEVAGCPVFHHPLYAHQAHLCKLCLDCLRSCPHGSIRLLARPPLQATWRLRDGSGSLAPFSTAVLLLALVLLAARGTGWAAGPLGLTLLSVAAVLSGALLAKALPRLLLGRHGDDSTVAWQVAFALLLLGWGPLIADQLENVPFLASLSLTLAPESLLAGYLPLHQVSLCTIAQVAVIGAAAVLALLTLQRIHHHTEQAGTMLSRNGWRLLIGFCCAYAITALLLLFLQ